MFIYISQETEIIKLNTKLEKADEKYQVQTNAYTELSKKHEGLLLEMTKNQVGIVRCSI